ncbi:MAG: ParB/RepB/Spo0J family partition protein [Gammaproteobacteria bacterium]|jgi:ParB family chromosome partitioning protein|nr:ParB/RepB/Spo0J family partition protein [Gammaproteobacteria bacterium]MBQ0774389.1 ParB/RepB/Spo0J family partition protein [Gammaproteobacteria bacterium]|tara:strand:- start:68991 stop:69902 length:912 start_codon:yes stop_codon:yes gene_type:complete
MTAKRKRGLSRGLDALISNARPPEGEVSVNEDNHSAEPVVPGAPRDGDLCRLPVELLERGRYQPRRDMSAEALQELSESIKAQGVMQPIVVRPLGEKRYEIIAGERRWRAAQMAGLATIPAVVREVSDEAAIAMALIENIQREDLNPMEEALALARLKDEFELTHQQVADAVGKSRAMVTNLLRLISLEEDVKKLLEHGDLEMGHARALLALSANSQIDAARTVVAKGLSVRQTEALVRDYAKEKPAAKVVERDDPNVKRLLSDVSDRLGAPVQLRQEKGGKGKLVISYNSLDELDGILAHIK